MTRVVVAVFGVSLAVSSAEAQGVGNEFLVNQQTFFDQQAPAISSASNGDFVISWNDGYYGRTNVRRYNSSGTALTAEIEAQDNGSTTQADVAVAGTGQFTAVWTDLSGIDGSGFGVFGQRFSAANAKVGAQFQVNVTTTGDQVDAAIAQRGDSFVVVWTDANDGDGKGIRAQRFDASGRVGAEFVVNEIIGSYQDSPDVGMASNGSFVVAWNDYYLYSIKARRFDAAGNGVGNEFEVAENDVFGAHPAIGVADDGSFIVAWEQNADGSSTGIAGRRFDSAGTAIGGEFAINTYTINPQTLPAVAMNASGDFVVSWQSLGQDNSNQAVIARAFSAAGVGGGEFLVNQATAGDQKTPAITRNGNQAVAAWASDDTSNFGVWARRFNVGPPTLSIGDITVAEGNAGTTAYSMPITLSAPSTEGVGVLWGTGAAGTATSNVDYVARAGSVFFSPGQTLKNANLAVIGDVLDEANETFYVNLSGASGATIADGQGKAVITDDDALPSITMGDSSIEEPDTGLKGATFYVYLSTASGRTVTVNYATGSSGSATSGVDYEAKTGVATFPPGSTSTFFKVQLIGDVADEANETYFVNLSGAVNGTITDAQGAGTIVDNDPTPGGSPSVSISDATVLEGDTGTTNIVFTVTLSAASASTVTVTYATGAGGTATSGVDYTPRSNFVTFTPGQTIRTFGITVLNDNLAEANETFFVNLTSAGNATIADGQGRGTINNDDAP